MRAAFACLALLAACTPAANPAANTATNAATSAAAAPAPSAANIPAGDYRTDPAHSSLIFRVNHLGYSHFTGRFETWTARLHLDPGHPEASTLEATIDPRSLNSDNPPTGFMDQIRGAEFLDSARFPQLTYRSTSITRTGANTATVNGDLTFHGVTHPVSLDVTFNGGYPGMSMDPQARIGFSAHGTLRRSEFGVAYGVPAPGTTMGVSDEVEFIIETEMLGPPLAAAPATPSAAH
jgi:polyisoprenoid-binding protein YceI